MWFGGSGCYLGDEVVGSNLGGCLIFFLLFFQHMLNNLKIVNDLK
jgi:hypothetical protein